jgi:hypothetical protein
MSISIAVYLQLSSETLACAYPYTRRHILKESNLYGQSPCNDLKPIYICFHINPLNTMRICFI